MQELSKHNTTPQKRIGSLFTCCPSSQGLRRHVNLVNDIRGDAWTLFTISGISYPFLLSALHVIIMSEEAMELLGSELLS